MPAETFPPWQIENSDEERVIYASEPVTFWKELQATIAASDTFKMHHSPRRQEPVMFSLCPNCSCTEQEQRKILASIIFVFTRIIFAQKIPAKFPGRKIIFGNLLPHSCIAIAEKIPGAIPAR